MPVALDLADQAVLVLLSTLLGLLALSGQVRLELVGIPAVVWGSDLVLPVLLDQVLKVLTVGSGRVGNVVVGEPPFELGLVPFVVCWMALSVVDPAEWRGRMMRGKMKDL